MLRFLSLLVCASLVFSLLGCQTIEMTSEDFDASLPENALYYSNFYIDRLVFAPDNDSRDFRTLSSYMIRNQYNYFDQEYKPDKASIPIVAQIETLTEDYSGFWNMASNVMGGLTLFVWPMNFYADRTYKVTVLDSESGVPITSREFTFHRWECLEFFGLGHVFAENDVGFTSEYESRVLATAIMQCVSSPEYRSYENNKANMRRMLQNLPLPDKR